MSFASMLVRTATVTTHTQTGTPDAHGNPAWVDGTPTDYPAWLEQTGEQEILVERNTQISDHRLFLGADAVIDGNSTVVVDGQAFTVVGPPKLRWTPAGAHHWEVDLKSIDAA